MHAAWLTLLMALAPTYAEEPGFLRPAQCRADLLVDTTLPPSVPLPAFAQSVASLGLPLVLLAQPIQLEGYQADLATLRAAGIEPGLWLPAPALGARDGPGPSWSKLRAERREVRLAWGAPPRAVGLSHLPPHLEGTLDALGFTLLLPAPDGLVEPPRRVEDLQGLEGAGMVVWAVQPQLDSDRGDGPWGSLGDLLDRTAAALELGAHPVVRLSLPPALLVRHAEVIARWRAEVVEPCGAEILSVDRAVTLSRGWLRNQPRSPGRGPPLGSAPALPSRIVHPGEVEAAASALACRAEPGTTLTRHPAPLSDLSEAWLAFALTLSSNPAPLPLHPVAPPQASPRSVLPAEGLELPRASIVRHAAAVVPPAGGQIPAFVRLDEHDLTAAELLCAMGAAVLGQDPVRITRTFSPDPYAPGLGWGGTEPASR